MRVQDIMKRRLTYCTPEWSLMKVANLMLEKGLGEIPVVVNHVPVGMITDRDIVCRVVANVGNPLDLLVGEVMTKVVVSVRSDASLKECRDIVEENEIRRMPVVDPTGEDLRHHWPKRDRFERF